MKILCSSQSGIAKEVASYAVNKYKNDLERISETLSNYDSNLPVNDIVDNLKELIYKKYFNYYKKTKDQWGDYDGYGTPPKNLDECIEQVDDNWNNNLGIDMIVCTRHKELIVNIWTRFVDWYMDSYYIIYDYNTGSAELQKSSSGEFRSSRGRETIYTRW